MKGKAADDIAGIKTELEELNTDARLKKVEAATEENGAVTKAITKLEESLEKKIAGLRSEVCVPLRLAVCCKVYTIVPRNMCTITFHTRCLVKRKGTLPLHHSMLLTTRVLRFETGRPVGENKGSARLKAN